MNPSKVFRKVQRGPFQFSLKEVKAIRVAIAQSLVKFFEKLKVAKS